MLIFHLPLPRMCKGHAKGWKSEPNAVSRTMEKAVATAKPEKWQNKQIKWNPSSSAKHFWVRRVSQKEDIAKKKADLINGRKTCRGFPLFATVCVAANLVTGFTSTTREKAKNKSHCHWFPSIHLHSHLWVLRSLFCIFCSLFQSVNPSQKVHG